MMDSAAAAREPSLIMRATSALAQADTLTKVCVACLALAWFFMDTLSASLGSLRHGVRFFQFGVLIADPTRMFFPIPFSTGLMLFAGLCLLCLAAPLFASFKGARAFQLLALLPLMLLAGSGLILYYRSSGDLLNASADAADLAGKVIRFANRLAHKGSDVISRHIAVAAGGYVALSAAVLLALNGMRRFLSGGASQRDK